MNKKIKYTNSPTREAKVFLQLILFSSLMKLNLVFCTLFFLSWSCTPQKEEKRDSIISDSQSEDKEQTSNITENSLFLDEFIHAGMSFRQIDSLFNTKSLRMIPEDFGNNYEETMLNYAVLGREGELKFNFRDSIMYSFYYELDSVNAHEGDTLYNHLQKIYRDRFADFAEEIINDKSNKINTTYWKRPDFEYVLTYNSQNKTLIWGLQERQ